MIGGGREGVIVSSTSEDARFLREGVIEVDAAMVGIGRDRWVSIDAAEATDERAAEIMRANRFDILPISSSGGVREYYGAKTWNDHSVIGKEALTHKDVVPLDTSIRDVIRGFATEGRLFYFLNDESRIVGLVSVTNLNARQVKLYLFGAISELEVRLGALISARVNEADLVAMTFGGTDKEKYDEVKKRYETDRANGVEVDFVEYLYLADLMRIAVAKGLHKVLGYSKTQFEKNFGSINDLRHRVAHPARSLVTGDHRVERLWKRIDRIEEALFALRLVDKACLVLCDLPVQYRVENFKKENLDLMRDRWEAITGAIERGVNLVNTFGIDRDTLTSANALIPIIYYLYQHPKVTLLGSTPFEARNAMAIRCWLTMALLNNVFGGQSDRTLGPVKE